MRCGRRADRRRKGAKLCMCVCARGRKIEGKDGASCIPLKFLSIVVHRGTVVHIRANRKIDKKRRFVKCRGRFSLLAVADRGWGWKWQSFHWVLTIVPVSIGTGLLNPFAARRWHRVGIGDTNAVRYSRRILRLCLAHNGFCFERNFVGAAVGLHTPHSAHCSCRQTISSNASPEFLRQKRKIKWRDKNS